MKQSHTEEPVYDATTETTCVLNGLIWTSLHVICLYFDISLWSICALVRSLPTIKVRLPNGKTSHFYLCDQVYERCRPLIEAREHNPAMEYRPPLLPRLPPLQIPRRRSHVLVREMKKASTPMARVISLHQWRVYRRHRKKW